VDHQRSGAVGYALRRPQRARLRPLSSFGEGRLFIDGLGSAAKERKAVLSDSQSGLSLTPAEECHRGLPRRYLRRRGSGYGGSP